MTDAELLAQGLMALDTALSHIIAMEIKSPHGEALAHFIHSALTYGEEIAKVYDVVKGN